MQYQVVILKRAEKDPSKLPRPLALRIVAGIKSYSLTGHGDVIRLTNHVPEYRLRVGDYRVLLDIRGDQLIIGRVKHRREAYR